VGRLKLRSRLIDQPAVELGVSRDQQDALRRGVQFERQLEGWRELALEENASKVGRESPGVELAPVDPTEDDGRAGKDLGPVLSMKSRAGPSAAITTSIVLPAYFARRKSRSWSG